MSPRITWLLVIGISVVALGATTIVGVLAWQQYQARVSAPSAAETAAPGNWADGDRIVFRSTASGQGYGHVASVPLDDPLGPRAVLDIPCDRIDATADEFVCLRTERGIAPSYAGTLHANDGSVLAEWPLSGIPSRTRISADGSKVASTAFVTGHSYATIGFSTETVVYDIDGTSSGSLEDFTLIVDGQPVAPVDRNFWGVTFIDDSTFYATAGLTTQGTTYLVRGDLRTRTLSSIAENVECPSLSPDGTRIAFKRVSERSGPTVHWTPAVYDLATGEVDLLPENRSVDDQIEWLDDDTILYGMPREGQPGDTDVWALEADGSKGPELFIEHAWSPAVVRD